MRLGFSGHYEPRSRIYTVYRCKVGSEGHSNVIEPTKSRPYTCPFWRMFGNQFPMAVFTEASLKFSYKYDSPWPWGGISSGSSEVFTLDLSTSPPRWMTGTPLH
jgi:hypothetical protein